MKNGRQIVVIYLAWLPYGISHFKYFIKSYLDHPAGFDHKLVIAFNGQSSSKDDAEEAYMEWLKDNQVNNVEYLHYQSGQDISIYKQVTDRIDADFFLFLNTFSRFKAHNWLLHYINNWKDNVGLIGASGSYASYLSAVIESTKFTLRSADTVGNKINKLKYLVKIFFLHGRHFKKFPAPHVRTNAFFTSKEIFSSLQHAMVKDKMEAYFFETGKNSMTEQVLKMGYKCIVIDKNGKSYDISQWAESKLFWNTNQEGLLVSDNQTRIYDELPAEEKKLYRKMAWGQQLTIDS